MSSTDPFKLLGLKRATATEADVKAAYARLLKVTRPEDGRDAFMALRQAFEAARTIARDNNATRDVVLPAQEPGTDAAAGQDDTIVPPVVQPEPPKWHHNAKLNWHFKSSESGILTEKTVKWMVAGGRKRAVFTADIAEGLIGLSEAEAAAFCTDVIEFIFVASDPDEQRHQRNIWEPLEGMRPEWMTDDIVFALHDDLGLLRRARPPDSYAARNYNTVLGLFAPVLDPKVQPLVSLDVITAFEQEQTSARKDAFGSYFDREKKEWVDMSPVSVAMRDLQAAFDRNMWDMIDVCRAILRRDDVQALDEFQDLDARLRYLICSQSGWQTTATRPVYPEWMRARLLELLDSTFGWSRHFGRHPWERQQFDWLHRVIGRDDALKAEVSWSNTHQPPPVPPPLVPSLFDIILSKPRNLLIGYFGYRVLQVLWRLVV